MHIVMLNHLVALVEDRVRLALMLGTITISRTTISTTSIVVTGAVVVTTTIGITMHRTPWLARLAAICEFTDHRVEE
jgi:hypothetical protein